jgi:hypothetical protein
VIPVGAGDLLLAPAATDSVEVRSTKLTLTADDSFLVRVEGGFEKVGCGSDREAW